LTAAELRFGLWSVLALTILSALLAAGAAVWAMRVAPRRHAGSFHEIVHTELGLIREEQARLAPLEAAYEQKRIVLEQRVRAANKALVAAMRTDNEAEIAAASSEVKAALAAVQDASIIHLLAMRAAIDARHRPAFDRALEGALVSGPP
jgi:hypothetical protein